MSYEILDLEHGDVLAAYDSLEVARQRLVEFLDGSPERGDEMAIATVDESGHVVGEMLLGSHVAEQYHVAG